MTTQFIAEKIKADVGTKILENAPLAFNNRIQSIICEMLQNARRAGATDVHIETIIYDNNYGRISIHDNGSGISPETFKNLLVFGGSGWDNITEALETPAGMGIFSLASRNPVIASSGLQVVLKKENFTGKEDALILPGDVTSGTTITFDIIPADFDRPKSISVFLNSSPEFNTICGFKQCIFAEALYCDMNIYLDNVKCPKMSFAEGAIATVKEGGCKIHIFLDDHDSKSPHLDKCGKVNFFGHLIPVREFQISVNNHYTTREHQSYAEIKQFEVFKSSLKTADSYFFTVEIENTSYLKPKLPDRLELHATPEIKRIVARAKHEIYKIISKLPFQSILEGDELEARKMGIHMPPRVDFITHEKHSEGYGKRCVFLKDQPVDENLIFVSNVPDSRCNPQNTIDHFLQELDDYYIATPNLTPYLPENRIGTAIKVTVTTSYGATHDCTMDFTSDESLRETETVFYDFIEKIAGETCCIVKNISCSLLNGAGEVIATKDLKFLATQSSCSGIFMPDDDTILFSKNLSSPDEALTVISASTFEYDVYDGTRYNDCDDMESAFQQDLMTNIIKNMMTKKDLPSLYKKIMERTIADADYEMVQNLRNAVETITITARRNPETGLMDVVSFKTQPKKDGN